MAQDPAKPKFSFGFKPAVVPKVAQAQPPVAKPASAFAAAAAAADDDDDHEDLDGHDGGAGSSGTSSAKGRIPTAKSATPASRAIRRKQQEAEQIDQSIFDYDAVYDSIKEAENKFKQAKQEQSAERKPKYIENFLQSADQRKRDRQRAEARSIQREREAEGDEFADKEAFVTSAYKEQQQQLAAEEQEEKRKQEQDRDKSQGMASFYRDMLDQQSAIRQAAISASATTTSSQRDTNDSDKPSEAPTEKSDAVLAKEAQQRGLTVELNDDNQIVDKRDLLTKGLNVVSKKRQTAAGSTSGSAHGREQERRRHRDEFDQQRANRNEQRARQSAIIEEQMLELERKRKLEEQEDRECEKQKANARRNDEQAVSSAKQRYLERKRQKMQESGAK